MMRFVIISWGRILDCLLSLSCISTIINTFSNTSIVICFFYYVHFLAFVNKIFITVKRSTILVLVNSGTLCTLNILPEFSHVSR